MADIIFEDFTGGLWQRGAAFNQGLRETPPNALASLVDAYPLPTGGVRSGPRWQLYDMTGISTGQKVVGFAVGQDGGTIARKRMHMITESFPKGTVRRNLSLTTGWNVTTMTTAEAASTAYDFTQVVSFAETSGGVVFDQQYFGFPHTYTTVQGIWSCDGSTAVTRETSTVFPNYLTAHQNRLVCVESTGTYRNTIRFTEPKSDVFLATTAGSVAIRDGSDITSLIPYFPNDLFVIKRGAQSYIVQGDLANPSISEAAQRGTGYVTWACKTPYGVAVMTRWDGIYLVGHGGQITHLTPNFVGSPMAQDFAVNNTGYLQAGSLFYYNDWLFTPLNYIYDFRTKAWFQSNFPTLAGGETVGGVAFWGVDDATGVVYASHNSDQNTPFVMYCNMGENNMTRATQYSMILPVIENIGRNARLRKVTIYFNPTGNNDSFQVSATPVPEAGQPATVSVGAATVGIAAFNISSEAPIVRLTITAYAQASDEAPAIKRVVLETQEGSGYSGGTAY